MKFIAIGIAILWLISAIGGTLYLIVGLKKVNELFKDINGKKFKFREKWCSGYSKKTLFTRIGGARNVLEVIVTDNELYIKGVMSFFTLIGTQYDLTHRVPISNVLIANQVKNNIEIQIKTAKGNISNIVLQLKDPNSFLSAVNG